MFVKPNTAVWEYFFTCGRFVETVDRGPVPAALGRATEAPLEERVLIGSVARVTEEIGRYRERVGLDLLICRVEVPGTSTEQQENSFGHLVEDVAPALC